MKPTALNHKAAGLALDCKAISDDGEFEGYASLFGVVDSGEDIVEKGAFRDSLKKRPAAQVKMLRDHFAADLIGKWNDIKEDSKGLFVAGKLLNGVVQKATETLALMRAGVLDGLSIGYKTINAVYTKNGQRLIKQADLWEVSVVTFPMLDPARVSAVKAAESIKSTREFEEFLRDAGGFSAARAKAIASVGFKSANLRDEGGGDNRTSLADMTAQLVSTLSN